MKVKLTAERASELIKEKLSTHFGLRPEDAGDEYIYKLLGGLFCARKTA